MRTDRFVRFRRAVLLIGAVAAAACSDGPLAPVVEDQDPRYGGPNSTLPPVDLNAVSQMRTSGTVKWFNDAKGF